MRAIAGFALLAVAISATAQVAPISGTRPTRLIVRNATIADGNGTPARGPFDIVVEGNTITQVVALDPVAMRGGASSRRPQGGAGTVEIERASCRERV